jgi:hypothetical protein
MFVKMDMEQKMAQHGRMPYHISNRLSKPHPYYPHDYRFTWLPVAIPDTIQPEIMRLILPVIGMDGRMPL